MNHFINEYNNLFVGLGSPPTTGELGYASAEKLLYYTQDVNPKIVVEIGFNRGSSSLVFLMSNPECVVYSIDVKSYEQVAGSVEFLKNTFPNRFHYISSNSQYMLDVLPKGIEPDLIFIDGDHSFAGILSDATLSKQLNPRCIMFDDACHHAHAVDTKNVIELMGWSSKTIIDCETSIHGREASSGFAVVRLR